MLVLDLDMQLLQSVTVTVYIACVITRFQGQNQGSFSVKDHSQHFLVDAGNLVSLVG
jgi:hypothetical protein